MTLIEAKSLNRPEDASLLFDEMKAIAIRFMKRTKAVEGQLNYIVSTCYVNAKKQAEDGDEWAAKLVAWMDPEIAKLKELSE